MGKRMMIRRVALVLAVSVPLMLLAIWLVAHARRLHAQAFQDVQVGMTQAEVEALVGGPPGNYGLYTWGVCFMTAEAYRGPPGSVERTWRDDSHEFIIFFDADNRVTAKGQRSHYEQRPPLSWSELLDCLR
jgi:hypothetical protein